MEGLPTIRSLNQRAFHQRSASGRSQGRVGQVCFDPVDGTEIKPEGLRTVILLTELSDNSLPLDYIGP